LLAHCRPDFLGIIVDADRRMGNERRHRPPGPLGASVHGW
jgi:hypothetical protein